MSESEFDREALEELREDLEGDFDEFVASFLAALDEGVRSMRQRAAARDYTAVSETAHGLKGTAGYLGASALVAALAELERAARARPPPRGIGGLIDAVVVPAARVRAHIFPRGCK